MAVRERFRKRHRLQFSALPEGNLGGGNAPLVVDVIAAAQKRPRSLEGGISEGGVAVDALDQSRVGEALQIHGIEPEGSDLSKIALRQAPIAEMRECPRAV